MQLKRLGKIIYLILLVLLILSFCSVVQAWENEDIKHWTDEKTETLEWGESFQNDKYKVEAFDFPRLDLRGQLTNRYVGIRLYENDVQVAEYFLDDWNNNYEIYNGEVKIVCDYLPVASEIVWQSDTYNPETKITIWLRGLPDIDIDVETGKDTFKLTDSKITITINIKNVGGAPLEDVKVNIDTDGLEFYKFGSNKETYFTYDKIEDGTSIAGISFELKIPAHMKDTVYKVSVNVTGIDERDEVHNYSNDKAITVMNMISIAKNTEDDIFMTNNALVQLIIRNDGTYGINNIELEDTLGDYFELIGGPSLQWNFDLGAGEFKDFQYTIKPVKPNKNGYDLPEARASWEVYGTEYNQTSGAPKIIVHGSKILIDKTVSPTNVEPNGDVKVTVTATNVGDVKASVEIFDNSPLPENVTLVSGELYTQKVIAEEDSVSLSYLVRADTDGIYELPQAKAKYKDLHDYYGEEVSDSPVFTAGNPPPASQTLRPGYTPTPTPAPSPTREEPGFGILAGLVGLSVAVLLALRR